MGWLVYILIFICLVLLFMQILYKRQIDSICRQLRVHSKEQTGADIWLDYIQGPFGKLQKEINVFIKSIREERAGYANAEKRHKEMIANVSHDIRTPITSISGYFQMLNETEDPEKRQEYVRIIQGRLKEFQDMLEDFFAYSASVSDDRKYEIESCNLTRCVSETLFLYYDDIEKKLGAVNLDFPEKDVYVYAEEATLKRILQNMIKNAINHGNGGFSVRIRREPDVVSLEIENTTDEKLPEHPQEVFERTYRGDPARSKSGTGLGLCIAKELTEKIGGCVGAECIGQKTFKITVKLKTSRIKEM